MVSSKWTNLALLQRRLGKAVRTPKGGSTLVAP